MRSSACCGAVEAAFDDTHPSLYASNGSSKPPTLVLQQESIMTTA
ncbi:MAG TPA: hypothetical protein VEI01_00845 [Terriglobales bacterium]|nr:hypothetical protein [Terriglobales bacterium]